MSNDGPATKVRAFPSARQGREQAYVARYPNPHTREAKQRDLESFRGFLGRPVATATPEDVDGWISMLGAAGRSAGTVRRRAGTVIHYLDHLTKRGELERNPAATAVLPKAGTQTPTVGLSQGEARTLLASCDDSTIGLRDRAMLASSLFQGLRVSEAIAVEVEDLGDDSGYPVLRVEGKGGKVVNVPLAPATVATLRAWLDHAAIESGPILRSVRKDGAVGGPLSRNGMFRRVRSLAKRAGITKRITPHSLRHTAVTLALDAGISLRHVQDFARHADPRTTRRYDLHRDSLNNPSAGAIVAAVTD